MPEKETGREGDFTSNVYRIILLESTIPVSPDTLKRSQENSVKVAGIRQQLVPVDSNDNRRSGGRPQRGGSTKHTLSRSLVVKTGTDTATEW